MKKVSMVLLAVLVALMGLVSCGDPDPVVEVSFEGLDGDGMWYFTGDGESSFGIDYQAALDYLRIEIVDEEVVFTFIPAIAEYAAGGAGEVWGHVEAQQGADFFVGTVEEDWNVGIMATPGIAAQNAGMETFGHWSTLVAMELVDGGVEATKVTDEDGDVSEETVSLAAWRVSVPVDDFDADAIGEWGEDVINAKIALFPAEEEGFDASTPFYGIPGGTGNAGATATDYVGEVVATPEIEGVYDETDEETTVTITTETEGATIYYQLDEHDEWQEYTGPFVVAWELDTDYVVDTVAAYATKDDMIDSRVAEETIAHPDAIVDITFQVDVSTAAEGEEVEGPVYVAGSFPSGNWNEPGSNPDFELELDEDTGLWEITLELIKESTVEFKFFEGAGWDGGEYDGGDNRSYEVGEEDATVMSYWGYPEAIAISIDEESYNVSEAPADIVVTVVDFTLPAETTEVTFDLNGTDTQATGADGVFTYTFSVGLVDSEADVEISEETTFTATYKELEASATVYTEAPARFAIRNIVLVNVEATYSGGTATHAALPGSDNWLAADFDNTGYASEITGGEVTFELNIDDLDGNNSADYQFKPVYDGTWITVNDNEMQLGDMENLDLSRPGYTFEDGKVYDITLDVSIAIDPASFTVTDVTP